MKTIETITFELTELEIIALADPISDIVQSVEAFNDSESWLLSEMAKEYINKHGLNKADKVFDLMHNINSVYLTIAKNSEELRNVSSKAEVMRMTFK